MQLAPPEKDRYQTPPSATNNKPRIHPNEKLGDGFAGAGGHWVTLALWHMHRVCGQTNATATGLRWPWPNRYHGFTRLGRGASNLEQVSSSMSLGMEARHNRDHQGSRPPPMRSSRCVASAAAAIIATAPIEVGGDRCGIIAALILKLLSMGCDLAVFGSLPLQVSIALRYRPWTLCADIARRCAPRLREKIATIHSVRSPCTFAPCCDLSVSDVAMRKLQTLPPFESAAHFRSRPNSRPISAC